ncbi:MAG: UDP-N-acetylmuramate dehydrogenase [Eubacteriaceae bacterium]|jgi:UDP-N-acetylmuramate dehydrogenase|nr:UDP-N-acetylmuramate dehydrogenase [Eubacteriaceae bacterium]
MSESFSMIREKLESKIKGNIIIGADMREYTSFKAGGCADMLIEPEGKEELRIAAAVLSAEGAEYMVIGNGSNILVRDGGYRGAVIHIGDMFAGIDVSGNELTAGSGALLAAVSRKALAAGLAGMEFASGIPGSIGGAVFMNAGAYGGEMKDIIKSVTVITREGEEKTLTNRELALGYRTSAVQKSGDIVTEAVLALTKGDRKSIEAAMKDFGARRNAKQPVNYPSAGSFFKRPAGYFAGKLIQDAGLKGLTVGGAQVSELHSGFIINTGGATASDIIRLMHLVQAAVMENSGVMLEPEVRIIGEDD